MSTSRPNNFIIQMIGANHTGKSTLTKKFISEYRLARPERLTYLDKLMPWEKVGDRKYNVIAFDPKLQFEGLVDQYIRPEKDWAYQVSKKARNSLIVLDDYKSLIPNYIATPGMFELFASRWHYNLDFIISCHSPGHVIDMLVDYITEYYIFHTKTSEGKFKEKMPNSEMLIRISKTINKYTAIYGLGKHPLALDFAGQRFPYMVFDTTKPDAIPKGYNMRKDFEF